MINSKFFRLSMLLIVFQSILLTGCQVEGVDTEDPNAGINTSGSETGNIYNPDGTLNINTQPSEVSLVEVVANETVNIEGRIDLNGNTVTLPPNVTLKYTGGEIINGTLDFSSGARIDSDLLNQRLSIVHYENVSLIDRSTFVLRPKRWGIVQGVVEDGIALENRDILESVMLMVKNNFGCDRLVINKLDAYFKVDGPLNTGVPEVLAINVPSDFHLDMSSETHLRMQPNGHFRAALLAIYNEENITITGGNLHGEREQHNYNSGYVDSDGATGPTNEWLNTMSIKGGKNITVDGVTFMDAAGDGLNISAIYHYFDPNNVQSENIHITNCTFLRARRTNLVLTSAEQVFIDNNEFIDGGANLSNSSGIAPSSNLNFEPVRHRNETTGELIEYERVSDVYITNNMQVVYDRELNPSAGGFQISHGSGPIIVENNEMINTGVSFYTVDGVIIRNNNITEAGISAGAAENINRDDFVYGNEVYNNTIETSNTGINVAGNGVLVSNNNIVANVGIVLGAGAANSSMGLSNSTISNNIIEAGNRAISSMNTLNNVTVDQNNINMLSGAPFAMTLSGTGDNYVVSNNTVTGNNSGTVSGAPPSLLGANNLEYSGNNCGEIQINGGSNMLVQNNFAEARIHKDGVVFTNDAPNTTLTNNEITIYPSQTPLAVNCITINPGVNLTSVTLDINNLCIEE